MKFLILALCATVCAAAVSDPAAVVLRSDFDQSPEGDFHYVYETDNGILGQAVGKVKQLAKDEHALEVTGSSSYKGPDGAVYELKYIADENGYQPQGAHLPTPPPPAPIPEYILRSLQYIAAHPYVEKKF